MKKILSVIVVALFSCLTQLYGQSAGFQTGFIITKEGDTIKGFVKYKNMVPNRVLEKIKFKPSQEAEDKSYSPEDLIGFTIESHTFISKFTTAFGESQKAFLKVIMTGPLNYYQLEYTGFGAGNITNYVILEKEGSKEQITYVINSIGFNFKKNLSAYLADVPHLAEKISSGEYTKKDLSSIVAEYNKHMKGD